MVKIENKKKEFGERVMVTSGKNFSSIGPVLHTKTLVPISFSREKRKILFHYVPLKLAKMIVDQTSFFGVTFHGECNGHTQRVIQCIRAISTVLSLHWSWSGVDDSPVRSEIFTDLFRSSETNPTRTAMASKRKRQATNKETYERNEPKMNICKPQNQRYAKHYHHSIKILIRDSSIVLVSPGRGILSPDTSVNERVRLRIRPFTWEKRSIYDRTSPYYMAP